MAHRWSYEFFYGPIEAGLHIDHLCEVKLCVNPVHLEAVTRSVNLSRAAEAFCKNGHPRTEANTRIWSSGRGVCRYCLDCRVERGVRKTKSSEFQHGL